MLLDQAKGYTTIASEIAHRSPASNGNDPVGMTRDIARWSGLDPNAFLNLRDPTLPGGSCAPTSAERRASLRNGMISTLA